MMPTSCQCKCFYCSLRDKEIYSGWEKNAAIVSAYEKAFDLLNYAKRENILSPRTAWNVNSGEITVHPFKKQILEQVKGYPVLFFTNGFIFDEGIAKELHDNPHAALNISLDAGTAETWHKVKGVNNFSHVLANLKKYISVAYHPQQIFFKYIIFPGINDSDEDFFAFAEIEKSLNMTAVNVSRDNRRFRNETPSYVPLSEQVLDSKLVESAARFVAIHHSLVGRVDLSNYTDAEQQQIFALAQKILNRV